MTLYEHRLIVICPLARLATLGSWWAANIDTADDATTWPPLALVAAPTVMTHRWCNTALVPADLRAIVVRICQLNGVTPPTLGTWNGWSAAEKKAWLATVRDGFWTTTGIWLDLAENGGAWDDPDAVLAGRGLVRLAVTQP